MKIISKFKDYYDNMRCYSMCSDDFTYIRKHNTIKNVDFKLNYNHYKLEIECVLLGFCGNWYPVYRVKKYEKEIISGWIEKQEIKEFKYGHLINRHKYFYYLKEALIHVTNKKDFKSGSKKHYIDIDYWTSNLKYKEGSSQIISYNNYINAIIKYEDEQLKNATQKLNKKDLFKKYNTPVMLIKKGILTINPSLKRLQMYKILEGYQCYQEIEMFIGNILLPRDNPDQITDDKILAGNHGFDKWSFRTRGNKNAR